MCLSIFLHRCPYFDACVLGYTNASQTNICNITEDPYTFIGKARLLSSLSLETELLSVFGSYHIHTYIPCITGRVGTVTYVPPPIESDEGMYLVTFNSGRSHYAFAKADLIVDNPSYNYEVGMYDCMYVGGIIERGESAVSHS